MAQTIRIPLVLEFSLDGVAPRELIAAVPATEAGGPKQPIIDTNYSTRLGFDTNFLGIATPLPTLVNPSVAAPKLDGSGNVLHYEHFSIVMHAERRLALYTASNVDYYEDLKKPEPGYSYSRKSLNGFTVNDRGEIWLLDNRIAAHHQVENVFYDRDNGAFQKGHIVRREDVCFGTSFSQVRRANGDTFHSTNCTPQRPNFNDASQSGIWGELEKFIADQADTEKLNLFAGPILADNDPFFDGRGNSGPLSLRIPQKFWKVVCANSGGRLQVFAFILEQKLDDIPTREFAVDAVWQRKQVALAELERQVSFVNFPAAFHSADMFRPRRRRTARGSTLISDSGMITRGSSPFRDRDAITPSTSSNTRLRSVSNSRVEAERVIETSGTAAWGIRVPATPGRNSANLPLAITAVEMAPQPPRLGIGRLRPTELSFAMETSARAVVESIIGNDERNRITETNAFPWRMICALRMDTSGGSFIGTGWLVSRKTIITAGHCVYDKTQMGGWANSITVTPGRDRNTRPFGDFTATRFRTNQVWFDSQNPDYDIGCIHLDAPVPEEIGSFGVAAYDAPNLADFLINIAGYPGDRGSGKEMYHHRNRILRVEERRLFYDVDTYGGQSGAPAWIHEADGAPPFVVGIHAYGTGATPADYGIEANSSPRLLPEVVELIQAWINENP